MIRIEMENGGVIDVELYPEKAPETGRRLLRHFLSYRNLNKRVKPVISSTSITDLPTFLAASVP